MVALALTAALLCPTTNSVSIGDELVVAPADPRPPVVWQMPLEHWDAIYTLRIDKTGKFPKLIKEVMPTEPDRNPSKSVGAVATPPPTATGVEQWRGLVAAYFPASQVDRALRVMKCESGGLATAHNPNDPSGAFGLMQVLGSWADNFGYVPQQLFDPDINLYVASLLYYDGGWAHWTCAR